jgi:hypothetical protein
MEIEINEAFAKKVKETVSYGLCRGLGKPELGKMCVEAAVNYACGLPHGDSPSCVGSAVRAFKITLNDGIWSSNEARGKGLQKIAIAQLGSNTIDQLAFAKIVIFKTVIILMPVILKYNGFPEGAALCENSKDLEEAIYNIRKIKNNIGTIPAASYIYRAINALSAPSNSSFTDFFAKFAATYAAAVAHISEKCLIISANICLEALMELQSPGCKYLYLCD